MSVDDGYRRMMHVLNGGKMDKQEPPLLKPSERIINGLIEDEVVYPPTPGPASPYHAIAKGVADTVATKNMAYGDAFGQSEKFLTMLYPRGIAPEQYRDLLVLVRMWDKMKRIATNKDALGEDPFADLTGYGILALARRQVKG